MAPSCAFSMMPIFRTASASIFARSMGMACIAWSGTMGCAAEDEPFLHISVESTVDIVTSTSESVDDTTQAAWPTEASSTEEIATWRDSDVDDPSSSSSSTADSDSTSEATSSATGIESHSSETSESSTESSDSASTDESSETETPDEESTTTSEPDAEVCPPYPFDPDSDDDIPLEHMWPISGSCVPDFPLASTFGPRLLASDGYRYDFHRGIDIPATAGSTVHAIARGEVLIAGTHPNYSEALVQLRHCRIGFGPSCDRPYYSNYIHLAEIGVAVGEVVEPGQPIGLSGVSKGGFAHIHFEIRDLDARKRNARHPLAYLTYFNRDTPTATIESFDQIPDTTPEVEVAIEVSGNQIDLQAVEIRLEAADGEVLASQRFDIHDWNETYTSTDLDAETDVLDDPEFGELTISPEIFSATTGVYRLAIRFRGLTAATNKDVAFLRLFVEDVRGGRRETLSDVTSIPSSE